MVDQVPAVVVAGEAEVRVAVVGVEAEAVGQLAEPLLGLEAFLGDDRAGRGLSASCLAPRATVSVSLPRNRPSLRGPSPGHAQVVGELGLGHALGDELLDCFPADPGELGAGGLVAGEQLARLLGLLEWVL